MSTTIRTVGQRGKTGESAGIVLRAMNRMMDENREVSFSLREMASEVGYTSTTVNNAVKNLRLSRKITRLGRDGYGMLYRVNPSGVIRKSPKKRVPRAGVADAHKIVSREEIERSEILSRRFVSGAK